MLKIHLQRKYRANFIEMMKLFHYSIFIPPLYVTFSVRPSVERHISGTLHLMIIIFGTNDDICRHFFHFFENFEFFGC